MIVDNVEGCAVLILLGCYFRFSRKKATIAS